MPDNFSEEELLESLIFPWLWQWVANAVCFLEQSWQSACCASYEDEPSLILPKAVWEPWRLKPSVWLYFLFVFVEKYVPCAEYPAKLRVWWSTRYFNTVGKRNQAGSSPHSRCCAYLAHLSCRKHLTRVWWNFLSHDWITWGDFSKRMLKLHYREWQAQIG